MEIHSLSESESELEPEFTEVEEQVLPEDSRRELD